ncbi:hypothetical protein DSECCO2_613870 [anaerobic digester metagenome]
MLVAVDDGLIEDAVIVENSIAVGGNFTGRHGVHVAGREPPQAAVAQARVPLLLQQLVQVQAEIAHGLPAFVLDAQRLDVVHQEPAGQKFQGHVVDPLGDGVVVGALGFQPLADQAVAHAVAQAEEVVHLPGRKGVAAEGQGHVPLDVVLEHFHGLVDLRAVHESSCF